MPQERHHEKNDAFSIGTIQKKMEIAEGEVVKLDGLLFSDGIPSRIAHWRSPYIYGIIPSVANILPPHGTSVQ